MKNKPLLIAILIIFLMLNVSGRIQFLSSSTNNLNETNQISNQDIIETDNPEEDEIHDIMNILMVNSIFQNVIMPNIKISINFVGTESLIYSKTFQSDYNGQLKVTYERDITRLKSIQITLPNNQRYFFNTIDFSYPDEIPSDYTLKINDKLVSNYVSKDENNLFNTNTIVMKQYFNGQDMNDKEAWKYLLNDETVKTKIQEELKNDNQTIDQFIDDIFLDMNQEQRSELWKRYNKRIQNGVNNYMNMLLSDELRANIVNITFYKVKAYDNPYTAYISAGSFLIKELDELNSAINSLEKWKRTSGKEIGYVFYDKNIYFNTHIKKIDPDLYN